MPLAHDRWLPPTTDRGLAVGVSARGPSSAAQLAADDEALARLGDRYRLERVAGIGGTSTVYLARDLLRDRNVAVKVLNSTCAKTPGMVERFRREAGLVRRLRHPNIAGYYEALDRPPLHAIVMEHVRGMSLDVLLRVSGGQMHLLRARMIMAQLLAAVQHLHSHDIIHRDLKPGNVMIAAPAGPTQPKTVAKLIDLGVATLNDPGVVDASVPLHVTGTVFYMSPEHTQAPAAVDHRSDIYSLGVTLYELVTGMVPFCAETLVQVMAAQVSEPPVPPRDLRSEIPVALNRIILRAMAKDPDQRFQSAAEMAAALRGVEFFGREPVVVQVPGRARIVRRGRPTPLAQELALCAMSTVIAPF